MVKRIAISAVIHIERDNAHHYRYNDDSRSIGRKDVMSDKKKEMRRTQKFLEAMQERVPRAKFAFGPESLCEA